MSSSKQGVLLKGLDGSNPLAFLAALGTLRVLSLALPAEKFKLSWELFEGAWRPWINYRVSLDELVDRLFANLIRDRSSHSTSFVDDNEAIAAFFTDARSGRTFPNGLDHWVAALVSDVHPKATSQLQLTRGDYFPGNLDMILQNTSVEHLRKTLLGPWQYDDKLDGQSLHVDPTEDRRHAYQWFKPNGDPTRKSAGNMLGANRLAIEALPLFLGLPSKNPGRLLVTGWTGVRSDDSRWTWPVWNRPIPLSVVRSLLAIGELQRDDLDVQRLSALGVVTAYRCRRIFVVKTPNLTPSYAVG